MTHRISRERMFMSMAEAVSQRSTCFRANIGAILVLDNNIISIGYNGPPSGEKHCTGNTCPTKACGGCKRSIHAEMNAYKRAPLISSFQWAETVLYCTHQPCEDCAEEILIHKTKKVFFMHPYRKQEGLENLLKGGTEVIRITQSGYMVNVLTNEIVKDETN